MHSGGLTHVKASDTLDQLQAYAGNVTFGDSAGIGVATTVVVRNGNVDAHVSSGASLTVGSLTVEAIQSVSGILVAGAGAGGGDAAIAGSVVVDVQSDSTSATIDGTTNASGDVKSLATEHTTITSVAGQLAIGGSAGVGVGVDVEVLTKDTEASIAPSASVTTTSGGNVEVESASTENMISIAAGLAVSGSASVAVNAGISVYSITTGATIGNGAQVVADGTVAVTADEGLKLDIIAGNIAVGGAAGVGLAGAVPVITKTTNAKIDDNANVTGLGNGGGVSVNTGSYTLTATDTRFDGASVTSNSINLGFDQGLQTGDAVIYDDGGGTAIGGLTQGDQYFVVTSDGQHVQLADSYAHATALSPTVLSLSPGAGESHRLVPTNSAQPTAQNNPYFSPSDVSGNSITLPYTLGLSSDDPVVYGAGGGAPIGGLTDGGTYYLSGTPRTAAALRRPSSSPRPRAAARSRSTSTQATGRAHSIVKQGKMPSPDASAFGPSLSRRRSTP